MKTRYILSIIIIINLFLNIYGNNWGLPSRWHSDEKVANALHMLHEKSFLDKRNFFYQTTGHQVVLSAWLIPYLIFLKSTNFPFKDLKQAASVSWIYMADKFPDFAINIYIYSRTLSAILGAMTVFLIFLLANRIYGGKSGIFSAAFLSVCMGFVGHNHYAKWPSLVNLLIVSTLLFCIMALNKEIISEAKKYFYLAAFLTGMAISVKFNAMSLLVPIFLTYILKFINSEQNKRLIIRFKNLLLIVIYSAFLFVIGFLVLTPSFLFYIKEYLYKIRILSPDFSLKYNSEYIGGVLPIYTGNINYFFELISIYGVPVFILILVGIILRILAFKKISKKEIVVYSFIIIYWSIITVFLKDIYPQTKHIIAIVPLLTLFAGKTMSDTFDSKKINSSLKWSIFLIIFLFSLAYTYKADLVFLKDDTRYASTKWIRENIPLGSKIEIFNQIHLLFADNIVNDYEIIYLGHSSKGRKAYSFPVWADIKDRDEYARYLNKNDSPSDYIIININYMTKLQAGNFVGYVPGVADYVTDLFKGKKNFVLVETFAPKNRKLVFKNLGMLILPQNFLWNPIPDYEAVSPTIYIFKRMKN